MSIYSLIESIAKNGKNNLKFNMTNSLQGNYNETIRNEDVIDLPLKAVKSDWQEIDNTLKKTYLIDNVKQKIYFIENVISASDKINHHPKIIIHDNNFQIVLFTHDINSISHYDLSLSKIIDDIYEDSKYII